MHVRVGNADFPHDTYRLPGRDHQEPCAEGGRAVDHVFSSTVDPTNLTIIRSRKVD